MTSLAQVRDIVRGSNVATLPGVVHSELSIISAMIDMVSQDHGCEGCDSDYRTHGQYSDYAAQLHAWLVGECPCTPAWTSFPRLRYEYLPDGPLTQATWTLAAWAADNEDTSLREQCTLP